MAILTCALQKKFRKAPKKTTRRWPFKTKFKKKMKKNRRKFIKKTLWPGINCVRQKINLQGWPFLIVHLSETLVPCMFACGGKKIYR